MRPQTGEETETNNAAASTITLSPAPQRKPTKVPTRNLITFNGPADLAKEEETRPETYSDLIGLFAQRAETASEASAPSIEMKELPSVPKHEIKTDKEEAAKGSQQQSLAL